MQTNKNDSIDLQLTPEDVAAYEQELDQLEDNHDINCNEWCCLMARFLNTFADLSEQSHSNKRSEK